MNRPVSLLPYAVPIPVESALETTAIQLYLLPLSEHTAKYDNASGASAVLQISVFLSDQLLCHSILGAKILS